MCHGCGEKGNWWDLLKKLGALGYVTETQGGRK
jgi:hypothetical protein